MPYSRLVLTAGTSAFPPNTASRNAPARWRDALSLPDNASPADHLAGLRATRLTIDNPTEVSAEYSLFHALRSSKRLAERPHVVLIHTDNGLGPLAAAYVQHALEAYGGATVALRVASGLNVADPGMLRRSLGDYLDVLSKALREGTPHDTCFGPLGGYKLMTSLGTLVGGLLGYPSIYVHEVGQVLHEVPALPLTIDAEALRAAAPLVRRLAHEDSLPLADLPKDLAEIATRAPFLFERVDVGRDTLVALNAFGLFLREDPRHRAALGTRILLHANVAALLGTADARATLRDNLVALLDDLAANRADPNAKRAELRHETAFSGAPKKGFHLYKGTSGRAGVFRAVYRFDTQGDTLTLTAAWTDHNAYERENLQALKHAPTQAADAEDWTEALAQP
jgi:putative CRISPR-associated protein (TIGR02619 family)